jgi:hypothetical protein
MALPIQDNEIPNGEVDPKTVIKKTQPQPQQESNNLDEYAFLLQNLKEQVKMEIKDELYKSITLKANSLMSVDPATSTALMGVAAAITGAVSQMNPVDMSQSEGQPAEPEPTGPPTGKPPVAEPPMPTAKPAKGKSPVAGPPQKTASDFIFDTIINHLKEKKYFELNKEAGEDVQQDLNNTIEYINYGANIYASNNDIDFSDTNTWDLLEELINDGTLYRTGYNEIINN